jgi:hypothetical protein
VLALFNCCFNDKDILYIILYIFIWIGDILNNVDIP